MTDAPTFLVITATPKPDKMQKMPGYLSQVLPVLISGGGKPVGRYRAVEHLGGDAGPAFTAIFEYPDAQSIRDVVAGDGFTALGDLRQEVFQRLDMTICGAL